MDFIAELEKELIGKNKAPKFNVGDTVDVHYRILEGDKERIQIFTGTVIAIKGRGIRKNFIVRRIVQGEGVERTFPLHSPNIGDIVVSRKGHVRRAKLYYLRQRVGKATKVRELLVGGKKGAIVQGTKKPEETTEVPETETPTTPGTSKK